MTPGKVRVVIELDRGIMASESNVSTLETIGILNGAIFNLIRNATAGNFNRPPNEADPGGPPPEARGSNRTPGFLVRKVDT